MKKFGKSGFLAVILIALVAMPVLASGSSQSAQGGAKQKLTFMFWRTDENQLVDIGREYNKWFNANNKFNVEVVLDETPHEQTKTKLPTLMASGSEPDMFHAWLGDYLRPYYEAGKLLNLTAAFNNDPAFKDQFQNGALAGVTFPDGNIYGFPGLMRADCAYYNKKIFDQLGLKIPDTYDELLAACKVIKESGLGIVPIGQGNREAWPMASFSAMVVDRIGGHDLVPGILSGKREWTDPVFAQALSRMKEMIPYFPDGFNSLVSDEGINMFLAGKAAVIIHTNAVNAILGPNSRISAEDVVVKPHPLFPQGKGDPRGVVGQCSDNIILSKSTKNAEAAIAYGKGFSSSEWMQKLVDIGETPAFKASHLDMSKMPALGRAVFDIQNQATTVQLYYDLQFGPVVGVEYNNVVQGIMGGNEPGAAFARYNQFFKDNYNPSKN